LLLQWSLISSLHLSMRSRLVDIGPVLLLIFSRFPFPLVSSSTGSVSWYGCQTFK
jgi:hypothetical protein